MRGIDVSSYQGRIDWNAVKKDNIDFVILRSITQNGKPDARFDEYYTGSVAAGFRPDVYVYMYDLTPESARVRAGKVVDLIRDRQVKRVWLDMELAAQRNLPKSRLTEIINAAAEVIRAAGYEVGIYCNQDWYDNVLDVPNLPYMYWIARYGLNNGTAPDKYRPEEAVIWQHTSNGLVDGIAGRVDMNICYKPELFDVMSDPAPAPSSGQAEVEALQNALNLDGYRDAAGRPLVVDGKMGPRTREAIRKVVLKRGSDGVTVDWVQKRINEIMAAGLDDDGKFGPATEAAVKDQQARAGLVVDGLCGPKTISSLL
ncbi:GH25 family lysozyme [Diplocloster modestus]|uniref:Peptidoglycan-binding protein n=1 Tax=Diplocloster modestus TaxID=2850322 RepID=A0ABS6K0Y3_9FIRM|nr:GH25 family lysozyme [Diplocloster modestus]MBU9724502.1 peptidoglycan-binding protein [Diplocloster modestus]